MSQVKKDACIALENAARLIEVKDALPKPDGGAQAYRELHSIEKAINLAVSMMKLPGQDYPYSVADEAKRRVRVVLRSMLAAGALKWKPGNPDSIYLHNEYSDAEGVGAKNAAQVLSAATQYDI